MGIRNRFETVGPVLPEHYHRASDFVRIAENTLPLLYPRLAIDVYILRPEMFDNPQISQKLALELRYMTRTGVIINYFPGYVSVVQSALETIADWTKKHHGVLDPESVDYEVGPKGIFISRNYIFK